LEQLIVWDITSSGGDPMPLYFFDIQNGHRLADPSGTSCKDIDDAIVRAKAFATSLSIDQSDADPKRHVSVLNESGDEVFRASVCSKPSDAHRMKVRGIQPRGQAMGLG
jgi:uncharacterized protein DUF6894